MRKFFVSAMLVAAVVVFSYCGSTKKAMAPVVAKVNYQANIVQLVQANCAPCHFPDKGGRKKPLDSYSAISAQMDEVLRRIQLEPSARGFMPDKKNKLAEADITVFKQWKADGLLEK